MLSTRGWAVLPSLLLVVGCGSSSDDKGSTGHVSKPQDPDATHFEVTWKPTTVQLGEGDAVGLASPTPSGGVLQFASATPAVQALQPGDLFVLPGVGLYKATSVTPSGSALALGVEEVSLMEAADSGDVSWDVGAHHMEKSALGIIGPASLPLAEGSSAPATYSGSLGSYTITLTLTPNGDRTDVNAIIDHQGDLGSLNVKLHGYVEAFRSQGSLQWVSGSTQSFSYNVNNYRADLTLDYDFQSIQGQVEKSIPLSMSWPFMLGPIPMYISLSTAFDFQSTMSSEGDVATGSVHFTYAGSYGVDGSSLSGHATMPEMTFDVVHSEQAAPITAGVGAVLEAPKVSLGMGVPAASNVFDAHLYTKIKNEVTSNLIIPNPMATGKPSCLKVSAGVGAYVGGQIALLGVPLSTEKALYENSQIIAQTGSACQ